MSIDLERVAGGLHFPTSLSFDGEGRLWVGESGLPFGGAPPGGRVLRWTGSLDGADAEQGRAGFEEVAAGLRAPLNGLTWDEGGFLVAEGGRPGRVSRLSTGGERATLVDDLPGFGNYQTNMVVRGADGWLYWSQGAMTNLGVIGFDSNELGWLRQMRHDVDVPGHEVRVSGQSFETDDPFHPGQRALSGVFTPFGTPGSERLVPAGLPCTAAVLRCRPDGTQLELVAWGLRNAYGLLVTPDGRLLATDQGADDRGSRAIGDAPDLLVQVRSGFWYGWPDYVGRVPVTDPRFRPQRGPALQAVILNPDALPPLAEPLLELPVNCAATKMAWIGDDQLLVCLFGDERPLTGPPGPKVGRQLARVDLSTRTLHPIDHAPLRRPIDVAIQDGQVYVLDFGAFEMEPARVDAVPGSGAVHRFPLAALEL